VRNKFVNLTLSSPSLTHLFDLIFSDYGGMANVMFDYLIEKGVTLGLSIVCEFIDDEITFVFPIVCVPIVFPNPFNVVCRAALAVLQIAELALETILDQEGFQAGLVNAAEIQAGTCTVVWFLFSYS
jgi:hypothetical protein